DLFSSLSGSPDPVFGSEESYEVDIWVFVDAIDRGLSRGVHSGLIREQPNTTTCDQMKGVF
ncbi:uncharacterized protein METZ01_LOCUS395376, partial [marine metagenome]